MVTIQSNGRVLIFVAEFAKIQSIRGEMRDFQILANPATTWFEIDDTYSFIIVGWKDPSILPCRKLQKVREIVQKITTQRRGSGVAVWGAG